jgi:hypothetical protein
MHVVVSTFSRSQVTLLDEQIKETIKKGKHYMDG